MILRRLIKTSWARAVGCALIAVTASLATVVPVSAVVVTDNFNADFNYALGAVGGIWSGSENMLNLNGGLFNANLSNPGVLTVEDNGTFDADGDPGNGVSGVGWEGGRSTAPFLFANVPAGQDFTATVKINSQTSGNWSAAGIIARAGNSPTPPGIGANHTDENFVTMYSFRTNANVPDVGTTLMKRIENGAQVSDIQINVNNPTTIPNPVPPPDTVSVPLNPLPTHVRLERVGGTGYVGSVSTDGGSTFQLQSIVFPTAGNPLGDSSVGMQVGLSYMNFGTLAGMTQFDDFTLDTHEPLMAPGAPTLTAAQTMVEVPQGGVAALLVTNTASGQGPLLWARTPNLAGTDAMLPGQGGPPSPLVPEPPENGSYFRWAVPATQAVGDYVVSVTAQNAWGQMSEPFALTIRVVPEPISIALVSLAIAGLAAVSRRRR